MAYQIDFTAANYRRRGWRKTFLRLSTLAFVGGAVWGAYDVYKTYHEPTLNMHLNAFSLPAMQIEEMNAAWDTAAGDYQAMVRYYRLIWAVNPTNFLTRIQAPDAVKLGGAYRPTRWTLRTGGACELTWAYTFNNGDKALQARAVSNDVATAVASATPVTGGNVAVRGVQLENLLRVEGFDVTAAFALPDVKQFPAKEAMLTACVKDIADVRRRVQETQLVAKPANGAPSTAKAAMMAYLPTGYGKGKPDFPEIADVIDVAGWFKKADSFILANNVPVSPAERAKQKAVWDAVGDARWPWKRFRALDNPQLVAQIELLKKVSDGVTRFKDFLHARKADGQKKLEPFIEGYEHDDVFNQDLIESDLRSRVAAVCGIPHATVTFEDVKDGQPAVLTKADEKFTFTWVRWKMSIGSNDAQRARPGGDAAEAAAPLTLKAVTDCARRALELGPGYALEEITVNFGDAGVTGAVMSGLLPVKKSEAIKKETVQKTEGKNQ